MILNKNALIRITALLCPVFFPVPLFAEPPSQTPEIDAAHLCGRLQNLGSLRVLNLWGGARERGVAHGYLLAQEIHDSLLSYLDESPISGGPETYERVTLPYTVIRLVPSDPRIERELRGILDGMKARLGEQGMMVEPLRRPFDIRDLRAIQFASDSSALACSSFSAWGRLTNEGHTIAARNLDWFASKCMVGHGLVIVNAADTKAHRFGWVSLTWPGAIGCYTAMNEQGVTLAIHDVAGRVPPLTPDVTPRPLVLREAIESARAHSAMADMAAAFSRFRILVGTNAAICVPSTAMPTPSAICEFDGFHEQSGGMAMRRPEKSLLWQVCTNHFRLRPGGNTAVPVADEKSGYCSRYDGLMSLLNHAEMTGKKVDVETAWDWLGTVAVKGSTGLLMLTQQSVVFEPDERVMYVAFARNGVPATSCKPTRVDVGQLILNAKSER